MNQLRRGKLLQTCLTISCVSYCSLLNMNTPSIKHVNTTKTVLFLTCKRHYKSDVSGFQDSTFALKAQWRRPLFFSEWLFRPNWKTRETL